IRSGEEFNDRLTWVKGKHNLQVGGEAQHYNVQIRNEFKRDGHFQFNGSYTGNTLADFLLGYVSSLDVGTGEYKDYRVLYASAFGRTSPDMARPAFAAEAASSSTSTATANRATTRRILRPRPSAITRRTRRRSARRTWRRSTTCSSDARTSSR